MVAPLKRVKKLAGDVRQMIESTRVRVAQGVNAELVIMNWRIDIRIPRDVLAEARAEYGEQIVSTLSRQLTAEMEPGSAARISSIWSVSWRLGQMKRW